MTLRQAIIDDVTTIFLNESDFAEEVVYHPRTGSSRTITAVVIREPRGVYTEDGTILPRAVLHVHNNSTTGISAEELDEGHDQIEYAVVDGKTPERRTITLLLNQDHGMIEIECR